MPHQADPRHAVVTVALFAGAREVVGQPSVTLTLAPPVRVADVRAALAERWPTRADLWQASLFAVGSEYATDATVVPPAAEVACLPPVSGG